MSPVLTAVSSLLLLLILTASDQSTLAIGVSCSRLEPPIVINTWNFTHANARALQELLANHSALDAIEFGCRQCEIDRCDTTVGWGGSPSETGETTLDAMIMDGETYDVGAVGGLRRVKSAISVARMVLERTNHTLLVGDMATKFALELGFKEESLESEESRVMHQKWLENSCQPNYWKNVQPDPRKFCGPYRVIPIPTDHVHDNAIGHEREYRPTEAEIERRQSFFRMIGHDTIGMVAIDSKGLIASGTSTNGLRNKILGRVGDSPVPGAGSYAAREAGAAAATGDGDIMMRFLLSYQAVENLRQGMSSENAALDVIERQTRRTGRPYPHAAIIVLSKDGTFGAACCGYRTFPFVVSDAKHHVKTYVVNCSV